MHETRAPLLLTIALCAACGVLDDPKKDDDKHVKAADAIAADIIHVDVRLPHDASASGWDGDAGGGPCTVDQDCPSLGLTCLIPICHPDLGCLLAPRQDGVACEDGNPCTAGGVCKQGVCRHGTPINCDDANPCTFDWCAEQDGVCHHTNTIKGSPCLHADPCVVAATCNQGKCVSSGPTWCECKQDPDCKGMEDGDLCNGTLRCDKQTFPYRCKLDPKTVITCSGTEDTACAKATCQPKTGLCVMQAVNEGGGCEDGDVCTAGDTCKAGTCAPGKSTCGG